MHPDGMAAAPEIPQSLSTVHSFAQGQFRREAGNGCPHNYGQIRWRCQPLGLAVGHTLLDWYSRIRWKYKDLLTRRND